MSRLDECIETLSDCLKIFESTLHIYHEHEASFKAWEAAIKKAHMENKVSGIMADVLLKTHDDWERRYLDVQKYSIKSEMAKKRLRLAEASWETERSKEVSLRNVK